MRWTLWFLLLLVAAGGLAITATFLYLNEGLPKISSLKDYRPPVVTTVYSDDNRKIAEFYKERRIVTPLTDMPGMLIDAFISAEDSRFFKHKGIDVLSILRAFFKNVGAGTIVQGGSTITQQVTRSFFLTPEKSYIRKMKEAILAYRIDRRFTKEEILFLYLNQIYLGHGAYGVQAAAENYFAKSVKELNLAECAMLAGLPQAPSRYSPFKHPRSAKERQQYVLNRMVEEGYITEAQAIAAFNTPLHIQPRRNWYLEEVPFYTEHVRRYVEQTYGQDVLFHEGLKIYTTANIEMTKIACEEMEKGVHALEERQGFQGPLRNLDGDQMEQRPIVQGALLCIEANTGNVKAMVGGRNFKDSQYNRAMQSRRQPGSAFKPVIYAAALDKGYTPATIIVDSPIVFQGHEKNAVWKPKNYNGTFLGPTLLRDALAHSRNIVTIKILRDIGIDYAIEYARKLGITSDLVHNLSLALGSSEVSLFELVRAYSVFANQGALIEPVFIKKIVDRSGRVLEEARPTQKSVIDSSTAFVMTSLLEGVVKYGTGRRVSALNRPVAGKTGTTNDLHDAWFVGYTPEYITGVWVGFDEESSLGNSETGAKAASPIWLGFMQRVLEGKPAHVFRVPEGVVFARIDSQTGLLPGTESKETVFECFKEGTVPSEPIKKPDAVIEPEDFFKLGL